MYNVQWRESNYTLSIINYTLLIIHWFCLCANIVITHYQVVIAVGSHLFPFRTEKLSPLAPMVLQCNAGEQVAAFFHQEPRLRKQSGLFLCLYNRFLRLFCVYTYDFHRKNMFVHTEYCSLYPGIVPQVLHDVCAYSDFQLSEEIWTISMEKRAKNCLFVKILLKYKFFVRNIWQFRKIVVLLHSLLRNQALLKATKERVL